MHVGWAVLATKLSLPPVNRWGAEGPSLSAGRFSLSNLRSHR